MEAAIGFLGEYGLMVIPLLLFAGAVGAPFPEDLVTVTTGYLVYKGSLPWLPALTVLWLAIITADSIMYGVGAFFGEKAIAEDRREIMRQRLDRRGPLLVFGSRFVFGARGAVFIASGAFGLDFRRFLTADVLAALIFVPSLFYLAVSSGENIEQMVLVIQESSRVVGILLAVVGLFAAGTWLRRRRSQAGV